MVSLHSVDMIPILTTQVSKGTGYKLGGDIRNKSYLIMCSLAKICQNSLNLVLLSFTLLVINEQM